MLEDCHQRSQGQRDLGVVAHSLVGVGQDLQRFLRASTRGGGSHQGSVSHVLSQAPQSGTAPFVVGDTHLPHSGVWGRQLLDDAGQQLGQHPLQLGIIRQSHSSQDALQRVHLDPASHTASVCEVS